MTTTTKPISNWDDIIDSRDVIARIDDLKDRDDLSDAEQHELAALRALTEEVEGYAEDWRFGAALIRDSYFEEHARELAEEIGLVAPSLDWPLNCIDWKKAARELQMDYFAFEFDGVPYWAR